jgi:hypothetical protein
MPMYDRAENDGTPEATTADQNSDIDLELVDKIKAEALIQAGYFIDDDGQQRMSHRQLQLAALTAMQDSHVVANKRELAARAVTNFELYQELLPTAPGAHSLPRSPEERVAQLQLQKLIWTYVNVGISSFVQKQVGPQAVILCEAEVARTKTNEETGKRQPTTERARFLTGNGDLIMQYFTGPAGMAFVRAARKLDAQLGLVRDRRPELAMPVAKQVGAMVKQAVASVPHADPKAVTALTAGRDDEAQDA